MVKCQQLPAYSIPRKPASDMVSNMSVSKCSPMESFNSTVGGNIASFVIIQAHMSAIKGTLLQCCLFSFRAFFLSGNFQSLFFALLWMIFLFLIVQVQWLHVFFVEPTMKPFSFSDIWCLWPSQQRSHNWNRVNRLDIWAYVWTPEMLTWSVQLVFRMHLSHKCI